MASGTEAQASLATYGRETARYLFVITVGILIAIPADTQQEVSKIQRIGRVQPVTENPAYRDEASRFLLAAVYLLGFYLIRKGVQESEHYPNSKVAITQLDWLIQEEEDLIQRLPLPQHWVLPKAGLIRGIAGQIWDGSLGEDASQNLGPEAVSDLLRLWQEFIRASEASQMRLKALIEFHPFPGTCAECTELQ